MRYRILRSIVRRMLQQRQLSRLMDIIWSEMTTVYYEDNVYDRYNILKAHVMRLRLDDLTHVKKRFP